MVLDKVVDFLLFVGKVTVVGGMGKYNLVINGSLTITTAITEKKFILFRIF